MGDLAVDTAVTEVGEGPAGGAEARRYTAVLSEEWAIWGPMGGYIASVALRAAGACSPFARPASFFCHYLGVAAFDTVDIEVTTLRAARTAIAQRAVITQGGKQMLDATIWSVGEVDGLAHDATTPPDVPGPDGLLLFEEHLTEEERNAAPQGYPFWQNIDGKPLEFRRERPTGPHDPQWRGWHRFRPTATFDDPWVDACRSLVLIDVQSWPSATPPHWGSPELERFYAPSLDLYVAFHEPCPESEWLLTDGRSPIARDGLIGWDGRLWSAERRLIASGAGQLLCRRLPGS